MKNIGCIARREPLVFLKIESIETHKFHEHCLGRDGCLNDFNCYGLRLEAKCCATTADVCFKLFDLLFKALDGSSVLDGIGCTRLPQHERGKTCTGRGQVIEECVILGIKPTAHRGDTIYHGIERTPFALQHCCASEALRHWVVRSRFDVQRNSPVGFPGQGGEVQQFLALRACRKIQGNVALADFIGAGLVRNRLCDITFCCEEYREIVECLCDIGVLRPEALLPHP